MSSMRSQKEILFPVVGRKNANFFVCEILRHAIHHCINSLLRAVSLQAYRSEKRVNAVMYGMAKDLTDEEIRILAAHYGK